MSAKAESTATWFHKRVVWRVGKEPRVWETKVVSPDGKEHFKLALIPLWAVEGRRSLPCRHWTVFNDCGIHINSEWAFS
jgi:hypothetical protein